MYPGASVFSQIMAYAPLYDFNKCVKRYSGDYKVQKFTCQTQFLIMAFAQLTYRESLRDIEACLNAMQSKLFHMGIRCHVSRSTLADANEQRDWRIYADFAQILINIARPLYANEDIGLELKEMVYALDSTTIDLCLTLFPWAHFRRHKAAIKMHTLIDIHGPIPLFIYISEGRMHDVNILDMLIPEPNAIYLMDRGYIDYQRLYFLNSEKAFFITLAKSNLSFRRIYSHSNDIANGLHSDQTILLVGALSLEAYPDKLRRIHYFDKGHQNHLYFLTNNFSLPALSIAKLYKCRWKVELFFKWIKQNLRIKAFYGLSENAVKIQIWIAICTYVLVAIIKKKMNLEMSLYTFLQVASVTIFENSPLIQVFSDVDAKEFTSDSCIQLNLFEL
jgi:hypothetical protein